LELDQFWSESPRSSKSEERSDKAKMDWFWSRFRTWTMVWRMRWGGTRKTGTPWRNRKFIR